MRGRIAGLIGNLLEHYDSALFGLLAPFIAPLFFAEQDPITVLILTYGMLPLGFVTRPLGSLFFGWLGDSWGRKPALCTSLLGMAFVTMGIGCLPVYRDIGVLAPVLLALARMCQGFFAAGGTIGGAIFVLEQTNSTQRTLISSLFDASSIAGVLLASGFTALLTIYGHAESSWRWLFIGGGVTALLGFFLRSLTAAEKPALRTNEGILAVIKENKAAFVAILSASGFSYSIFAMTFTLMNGYVPLVTELSRAEAILDNTLLLFLSMVMLPCFGYLASRWGREKVMLLGAGTAFTLAFPLFAVLEQAPFGARLLLVMAGSCFAAPYYAWTLDQVPMRHRCLVISLGSALGSQLVGSPTSAICLWLYKTTGWTTAPAFYLMAGALLASFAVYRSAIAIRAQAPLES